MLIRGLVRISHILKTLPASAHPHITMKSLTLSSSFFYLSFCCTIHVVISAQDDCDKSECPGPIAYYRNLRCAPVYADKGSCCADKYDCGHLDGRSTHKCYRNGHEYALGEKLKDEHANPCDIECICTIGYDGVASFNCAIVDCFYGPVKPDCYRKHTPLDCCPGEEICPEKPSDRPQCEVEGKMYKDGEYFSVTDSPDLNCVCSEGYTGKNVEPWCKRPNAPYCSPEFRHAGDIHRNCAPVYYSNQSPVTSCSVFSRCQNNNDTIIKAEDDAAALDPDDANSDLKCKFGNMTMSRGEQLNMATDYSSVCVKCVCEVPPLPTCQRLPDEECDITKHPAFHNFD